MMFLKTTLFSYQGEQVTLYELSALQRAEYFEFLAAQATDTPTETGGIAHTAAMIRLNTETAAWLVSRSLWHAQREQAVDSLYREVLASWPDNALALAVEQVLRLSDMKGAEPTDERDDEGQDDSLEKPLPAS